MKRLVPALLPFVVTAAHAQRDLKEIPSVDPAVEQASFKLAAGLEVNLFAQEPMIAKPIQMSWDDRGRLWVASSAIYPHIKPGQEQSDKIVILEDTNGDGKADKSTVFFEGLIIPTGIMPGDGGAYVANSTELLFMKDTDGDGRADTREVLLSGFGTEDTHHILHSIKRGPDGCVYFNQSVYIHTHAETPFGVRRLMGSGIWQYRPETGRMEVFTMGQVNPWGHVWDQWGQSFTTDGAYGEGINYGFPGATFLCLPNQLPRILKGLNPGQPKQCGLEVISGRHFPAEWQGDMITNDFRGHRVNRFKLSDQGSGFASRQMEDVIQSNHGSFRPIDVRMGPDGALYIADWYNPIIQHGEVDFRDERRDHTNGRIWRVSAKDRALSPRVDYAKAGTAELVSLLKAPEQWMRLDARQELSRRARKSPEVATAVLAAFDAGVVADGDKAGGFSAEAFGLFVELAGVVGPNGAAENPDAALEVCAAMLKSPKMEVRALGVRLAGYVALFENVSAESRSLMVQGAQSIVSDPSARVRLEGVNALRRVATAAAVERAAQVLDQPMDENLDFSLWLTCRELAGTWLPAFQKGEITFGGNVAQIAFALKAADKPEAVGALLNLTAEGKVAGDRVRDVVALVGALGSPEDLTRLAAMAAANPAMAEAAADALVTAARQRGVMLDAAVVRPLAGAGGDAAKPAAIRLAGVYKVEDLRGSLESLAGKGGAATDAALEALVAMGGEKTTAFLTGLAGAATGAQLKGQALAALFTLNPAAASSLIAAYFDTLSEPAAASRIFESALARKDGPALLAAALKDRKITPAVAAAGVQKASAAGGDTKGLIEALTLAGGLQPVMTLTPEQMNQMMADVKSSGDPVRGETVYRRQAQLCQTCHAIGAVGGIVGPDLVSIGASAPVDYIIDSLLEPGKKIKEGYATTMVTTKDGGVQTGFLVREDAREVILRDPAGNVTSIPAASVAKKESIPVSLMPPGLTASLRRDEFIDLVRFLSELGKEGNYKVQEDGTLRRWRTAQPPADAWRWMNLKGNKGFADAAGELSWTPLYSRVDGTLHGADAALIQTGANEWRAVQSEISVSEAGEIGLRLNDPAGLQIWIGDQAVTAAGEIRAAAPAGKVRVTILFDTAVRKNPVKVQVFDVPGSPAKTKAVGGV